VSLILQKSLKAYRNWKTDKIFYDALKGAAVETLKKNDIEFIAGHWPLNPDLDTIVFIHGSGGTNVLWHAQVKSLANKFNTLAVNLPGHGNSEGNGLDRMEDYAKSMSDFIKSINVRNPIICGLSIGGGIVLQMLIDESDNFKAGIVVNSGAKLKVMPMIFEMIEKDFSGFVNSMYSFGISQKTNPNKLKPLADSMLACPPDVTRKDFTACDTFDVRNKLNTIKTPVLVMTASEDLLTPIKYGQFLADQIDTATIANIDDAGHLSPVEQPENVVRAICDFIETL